MNGVAVLKKSIESAWRESVHPCLLYPWPNKYGPGARFKDDRRDLPPKDCIPAADCVRGTGRDDRRNAGWIDKKMLRALNKTP